MIDVNPIPAAGPSGPSARVGLPSDRVQLPSDRVRLATAARDAVLRLPGVISTDAGPTAMYVTKSDDRRVEGVICAAANDGGYDISVWLIAGLVSLPDLSDQIATAIGRAALRVGVQCSSVSIHFTDLRALEEV